jgi:hypothetical protein
MALPREFVMRKGRFGKAAFAAVVAWCCVAALPARGGSIDTLLTQSGATYSQDPGGLFGQGYFFIGEAIQDASLSFDQGVLTYPGPGSPVQLGHVGKIFIHFSPSLNSLADLNAAYPGGTYTATLSNSVSGATASASLQYSPDAIPNAAPVITPATLPGFKLLNPAQPYTLAFNSFTADPQATKSYTEVEYQSSDGNQTVDLFLPPGTTSYTIPANTLEPNMQYFAYLNFENDFNGTDGPTTTIQQSYMLTQFSFNTGASVVVPEPTGLALAGVCLGGLAWRSWRRQGKN